LQQGAAGDQATKGSVAPGEGDRRDPAEIVGESRDRHRFRVADDGKEWVKNRSRLSSGEEPAILRLALLIVWGAAGASLGVRDSEYAQHLCCQSSSRRMRAAHDCGMPCPGAAVLLLQ